MSPDNNKPAAAKPSGKEDCQSSGGRKTTSGRSQEPALKCPRCDSPNTKFCYYNNYSLTQPRHFCKTCRRYWTRGGAQRNVPIGGGCRKNKKTTKSSSMISGGDSKDSGGGSTDIGGLKFFQGISPAMDFQLNFRRNIVSPNTGLLINQFASFGEISSNSCGAVPSNPIYNPTLDPSPPLMGFGFPNFSSALNQADQLGQSLNVHNSVASSIESLSSINQDLHWKLQKQRLNMLFGGNDEIQKENPCVETHVQKPQPILFQNLEISSKQDQSCGIGTPGRDGGGDHNLSTEWFFDNTYANVAAQTPATSGSNAVNHDQNGSSWSGIQAWSDLTQYTSLP